jgi:RNA polymerase sigma factor (sigma-70 family)
MTAAEERRLWEHATIMGDNDARYDLVANHMRLVPSIVTKIIGRRFTSIPREDLEQTGYEALLKAVDKFDPYSYNTRFSTFATTYITGEVTREIQNNGRMVKLPVNIDEQITALLAIERELRKEFLREPTLAEVERRWDKLRENRGKLRPYLSASELRVIQSREPTSLDQILEADASKETSQQFEWE